MGSKKAGRTYLGSGVASILIVLIILMLACFAALTFVSADTELKLSQKSRTYCDNYYAAETTAVEILAGLSEDGPQISEDRQGKITYNDGTTEIVISKKGNTVSFAVPINGRQELAVSADITESDVDTNRWFVRGR